MVNCPIEVAEKFSSNELLDNTDSSEMKGNIPIWINSGKNIECSENAVNICVMKNQKVLLHQIYF